MPAFLVALGLLAMPTLPTEPMPRIPLGPFVRAKNGDILAINDGYVRRSPDGERFTGTRMFPDRDIEPLNDSALLVTASGRVVSLFIDRKSLKYTWDTRDNRLTDDSASDVYIGTSDDHGKTWRLVGPLQRTYSGATRGLAEVKPGCLVATSQEMTADKPRNATVVFTSEDNGDTWRRAATLDKGGRGHHDGAYEADVIAVDGGVLMVARTNEDRLYWSKSPTGQTWPALKPLNVEASSSPAGLLRLGDGRLLMVYNPLMPEGARGVARAGGQSSQRAASWFRRELWARVSSDEGRSWSSPRRLWTDRKDVAYPRLFEVSPGVVWVTTYQGQARFRFDMRDW